MGRPRKVNQGYDELVREQRRARRPPAEPVSLVEGEKLIPIEGPEMDATPFGKMTSIYMRRRWVRQGKLRCIRIGRQTFISERAIAEFIASGGSR